MVSKDDNNNNIGKDSNNNRPIGMRNVAAFGVVSFFSDFSTEMILAILQLFIVSSLGLSKAALGSIEGSAELISYAFRMISGTMSDKVGRRKSFIIIGYALSTVSKPFFAATSEWMDTFLVRASDRIGKGIRTSPRDALIADSVTEKRVGKAFGIHRTIDQMGAIIGPVAAFALLHITNIRGVFLFSLIPGAIAVIVLIFFVKEVIIKGKADSIPLVYAVINITHTAVGIPSGIMADKIGKEKVLMIGYAIFAVSASLMSLLYGNVLYAFTIGAIYGVYMGISETMQRAILPRHVSPDLMGSAYGLYNLVIGTTLFVGNILIGLLWDKYNINFATTYSITMSIAAMTGMLFFIRTHSTNL